MLEQGASPAELAQLVAGILGSENSEVLMGQLLQEMQDEKISPEMMMGAIPGIVDGLEGVAKEEEGAPSAFKELLEEGDLNAARNRNEESSGEVKEDDKATPLVCG